MKKFIKKIFLQKKKRYYKFNNKNLKKNRLSIFKSNKNIYVQVINDLEQKTIVSYSSLNKNFKLKKKSTKIIAFYIGQELYKKILIENFNKIFFDKKKKYHGRIKALICGFRSLDNTNII